MSPARAVPSPGPETICLENCSLRFTARVRGAGPTVLCLHGFPDNNASFHRQEAFLDAAGYRVVSPTLRGYEPSSQRTFNDYHTVSLVGDVIAWLDCLGLRRAHLVAHDWGAIIAYAAAACYPERITSLTAIAIPSTPVFLKWCLRHPGQLRLSWYMFFFQLPILPELYLRRGDFAFVDSFYRRWSPRWDFPNSVVESVKETFRQPGVAGAALSYYRNLPDLASRLGRESWRALLAPVRIPTLVITGEKDGCVDTRAMDLMTSEPGREAELRVVRIPDGGHFLHQEKPDEVSALILDWIRTHPSDGSESCASQGLDRVETASLWPPGIP